MLLLPKGNTPRWLIFVLDLILCLVSLSIAYLFRFDFVEPEGNQLSNEWKILKPALPIYIVIRALSFVIAKTYSGIIRFTSTQDAKRIFLTVLAGSVVFGLFSLVRINFVDAYFFLPVSILILEFFFTFFLLIAIRVAVKLLYVEQNKSRGATQNVVIYGAGEMGRATKRILEQDANTLYNVVGFIDDNPSLHGKMIERTTIKPVSKLKSWSEKKEIDTLIFAIKAPNTENSREIINLCLDLNLELLRVPKVETWINGEFSTKQIKKVRIEDLLGRKEIELNSANISKFITGKRILVTGAAGSIGSEIARQCLAYQPAKLILVDQAESALYDLVQELTNAGVTPNWEIVIADVSNEIRMRNTFMTLKPEVVFHAAAYKHVPLMEDNPAEAIRVNVGGTKILAQIANETEVATFVMVSTDKAVNPTNVMGASKRIAEIFVQALSKNSKTKFITTRFGNVLGSNGSVIPLFRRQIENGGPLTVTHADITRYFMTIPEACQLVLEAGTMGQGGEVFVFDMGESIKIIDLAKRMIQLSGLELDKDIQIKVTGLRPGEKLYEELLTNEENTIPTHHHKIMIGKVKEYNFDTINTTIGELVSSYSTQDNFEIVKKMKEIVPEFISNNSIYSKFDS
ncbi:MAG: FlaA1/EpsC-like NDP-sugar epimerase [Flavobacteriales bacterium]|jgi:FlaA1/EpsC-like NDP-sugar epimerase